MRSLLFGLLLVLGVVRVRSQFDPNFADGKGTIVHLFEWRWNDIAEECERYLGPMGFGGVQVSPITENVVITDPFRPWYERYQTVSYGDMTTRSGTEEEFVAMVRRCNNAGVRIYPDTIVNHMTGGGSFGYGSGGSWFNTSAREYPEYNISHFNPRSKCPSASGGIEDWDDPIQVRDCELVGLADLDQSIEHVRQTIVNFMNKMIGYGVAGFRIDAAKHVWPQDMKIMMERLNDLPAGHGFKPGARPFIYQEVTGAYPHDKVHASDYFPIGKVTEFNYGVFMRQVFAGDTPLSRLINFGSDWTMHPSEYAFVFLDNHDKQREHGGHTVLTFRDGMTYAVGAAFMLSYPFGEPRIMSSYYWEQNMEGEEDLNTWIGPPHRNGDTLPVIINPDQSCGNGWICEHRWPQIRRMAKFRNVVAGTNLTNWWDNGNNQIAFSRGNKGFIAFNKENSPLNATLQTGLPAGRYCDSFWGDKIYGECTGSSVTVGSDGRADIYIPADARVLAIHAESKV